MITTTLRYHVLSDKGEGTAVEKVTTNNIPGDEREDGVGRAFAVLQHEISEWAEKSTAAIYPLSYGESAYQRHLRREGDIWYFEESRREYVQLDEPLAIKGRTVEGIITYWKTQLVKRCWIAVEGTQE